MSGPGARSIPLVSFKMVTPMLLKVIDMCMPVMSADMKISHTVDIGM